MIVEGVDPRDIDWKSDRPAYRVYFWKLPPAPLGVAQEQVMWHCDEYRLTGATDVDEVLGWAREQVKAEQTFVVYVECGGPPRKGLVRLWGVDPNADA
ncbi:hypothetical protein ACLM5J_04940 [Nocardioides sp. Bht2]|uniref:hypothetical protein n=1 Tax=Nocardioides sp. Bht2 TaxID=3392297 RepID=UPI0039B4FFA7